MKRIITFMAWVIILSCCNKKIETRPNLELDQQTKDYTLFKENSLWVYKLEGQSLTDTNKLATSKLASGYNNQTDYDYENNEMSYYSTYQKKVFYNRCEAYDAPTGVNINLIWFDGARTSTKCMFFSNKAVGDTYNYWYYPDNIVTYQSYLPTYTLEGKTYNEVMVFESCYTGASMPFDDVRLPVKVWYAKHVGIIRKEMKNGDVWNLIAHDVKQ